MPKYRATMPPTPLVRCRMDDPLDAATLAALLARARREGAADMQERAVRACMAESALYAHEAGRRAAINCAVSVGLLPIVDVEHG